MSEKNLNMNEFWRNLSHEDILCGLLHAEENKERREQKGVLPPVVFLTKKIEEIQGGPDEEAKQRREYGSKQKATMPHGFDEEDEGLKKAECMLAFLDEALTRTPENRDERMAEEARNGAGYICRIASHLIGHYRTNLCNSVDYLQKVMAENGESQKESQEGGGHE